MSDCVYYLNVVTHFVCWLLGQATLALHDNSNEVTSDMLESVTLFLIVYVF